MFKKTIYLFIIFILVISCRRAIMRPSLDSMGKPPEEPDLPVVDVDPDQPDTKPEPDPQPESEFIIIATDDETIIESKIKKYHEKYKKYIAFLEGTEEDIKQNNIIEKIDTVINKDVFYNGVVLDLTRTTITEIPNSSFDLNKYLYHIIFPKTLISIGDRAFADATKLTIIDFPSSLREIGKNAFEKCVSLEEVNLKDTGITILNKYIFNECYNLSKIVLPDKLLNIENNAFSYCRSLKEITFPSDFQVIKEYAFFGCENLKEVNFNDGIEYIYYMAFSLCSSISDISLPSSLKEIGVTGSEVFSFSVLSKVEYLGKEPDTINYLGNIFGTSTNPENLYLPNVEEPVDPTIKEKWNKFLGYDWTGKIIYKTPMPKN